MLIRCYGARGSIPVSGEKYNKYGGDTTCIEIRTKNNVVVIIDAGSGIRVLGNRLMEEKTKDINIIFTHSHWDHIMGFPFFKPIYFNRNITFYGCPFAQRTIKNMISKTMEPPNFPVRFSDVNAEFTFHSVCKKMFRIDSLEIHPILLSHPNQGIGYKIIEDGRSFVFLTDNELDYKHEGGLDYSDYVHFSRNCDFLIHDSEYLEEEYSSRKMWGHSVFTRALQLALDANVKKFGLYHHNQERSDSQIDSMVDQCKNIISSKGSEMECFAVSSEFELEL